MRSETLQKTEEYSASKSTHPRVSLGDMEGKIAREEYFTGADVLTQQIGRDGSPDPTATLTFCLLVMRNGFVVVGKSAPASPENFDKEKGRRFAYEDAIKQLWPLEGYALRERLSV